MKRIGLAMVIVGMGMLVGQTIIAGPFIAFMTFVYPNASSTTIANGSWIALKIVGFSLVIGGVIIFLIYRNR